MDKTYIENKKQELQKELMLIKQQILKILSKFKISSCNNAAANDIQRLKIDCENEQWYMVTSSIRFLKTTLVYLEKNEKIKEQNLILWNKLNDLCSNLYNTLREFNNCDSIMDKGPLCVENKTIIITDPCYLMKKGDETNCPKWDDYFSHKDMRDYPDYNGKDISKQYTEDYKKYNKVYQKWAKENPDDWDTCDCGANMEVLGIKNYLCADTIYGDWSCSTFNDDTGEYIGEFCADAGLVCVCLLDEVLAYNPNFLNWAKEHQWCVTIIENFIGEIWIKVLPYEEDDYDDEEYKYENEQEYEVSVQGYGNINFSTCQTGL